MSTAKDPVDPTLLAEKTEELTQIPSFFARYKPDETTIENMRSVSIFIIAISTFFSYLYYNFSILLYEKNEDIIKPYAMIFPFITLHIFLDLFQKNTVIFQVHHIFVLGSCFYNIYYDVSPFYGFPIFYTLLNTEISTIFYILKIWLPKTWSFYNINKLLFYLTFFKFRIYDYFYELIYKFDHLNFVIQTYSYSNNYLTAILLISCYGLFVLNIYWFVLMNRMMYKSFVNTNPGKISNGD